MRRPRGRRARRPEGSATVSLLQGIGTFPPVEIGGGVVCSIRTQGYRLADSRTGWIRAALVARITLGQAGAVLCEGPPDIAGQVVFAPAARGLIFWGAWPMGADDSIVKIPERSICGGRSIRVRFWWAWQPARGSVGGAPHRGRLKGDHRRRLLLWLRQKQKTLQRGSPMRGSFCRRIVSCLDLGVCEID